MSLVPPPTRFQQFLYDGDLLSNLFETEQASIDDQDLKNEIAEMIDDTVEEEKEDEKEEEEEDEHRPACARERTLERILYELTVSIDRARQQCFEVHTIRAVSNQDNKLVTLMLPPGFIALGEVVKVIEFLTNCSIDSYVYDYARPVSVHIPFAGEVVCTERIMSTDPSFLIEVFHDSHRVVGDESQCRSSRSFPRIGPAFLTYRRLSINTVRCFASRTAS